MQVRIEGLLINKTHPFEAATKDDARLLHGFDTKKARRLTCKTIGSNPCASSISM